MNSNKVEILCSQEERDYLIYEIKVRRKGIAIAKIDLSVGEGDKVAKGDVLGKIVCEDLSSKDIKTKVNGWIKKVISPLRLHDVSILICTIEMCSHEECEATDLKHMQTCGKCGEEVWVQRDKNVVVAKHMNEFKGSARFIDSHEMDIIWSNKIRRNEIVHPVQELFKGVSCVSGNEDEDDSEDDNMEISFSAKECIYIIDINFNYNRDKSWILKYQRVVCSHQIIDYKGNCSFCSAHVQQHRNLLYVGLDKQLVGKEYAELSKKRAHQELFQQQKLILVLDLDNTLLHAIPSINSAIYERKVDKKESSTEQKENSVDKSKFSENIQESAQEDHEMCIEDSQKQTESSKTYDNFCEFIFDNSGNKYIIRIRPYMKEFLESILPHFEIYIFTIATLDYAKCVCDHLKRTYSEILSSYPNAFSYERIISREHNRSQNNSKDLQQILPNSDKIMLILDDRFDVWPENQRNILTTLPYIYWADGSESWNNQVFQALLQIQKNKFFYLHTQSIANRMITRKSNPISTSTSTPTNPISTPTNPISTPTSPISTPTNPISTSTYLLNADSIKPNTDTSQPLNVDTTLQVKIDTIEQFNVDATQSLNEDSPTHTQPLNADSTTLPLNNDSTIQQLNVDQTTQPLNADYATQPLNVDTNQSVINQRIELKIEAFNKQNVKDQIIKLYDNKQFYEKDVMLEYHLQVIKEPDNYLLLAGPILERLKQSFYKNFEQESNQSEQTEQTEQKECDIRDTLQEYQTSVLAGMRIGISSVIKEMDSLQKNQVCKRIVALGGNVMQSFESVKEIDVLVIGGPIRTHKVKNAQDAGIPILSDKWIEYCWFFNYKLDMDIFRVNPQDLALHKSNQQIEQEIFNKYTNKNIF